MEIRLAGNKLTDAFFQVLTPFCKLFNSITYLDLSRNALGDYGVMNLAAVVPSCMQLRHLFLADNRMSDKSFMSLLSVIRDNMILELDVSSNFLTVSSILSLSADIENDEFPVLKTLILADNQLDVVGCQAIFSALCRNTSITKLDMSKTGLLGSCGPDVADMLTKNKSLKDLNLSDNEIGTEGCLTIGSALYGNSSLTTLKMDRVDLGKDPDQIAYGVFLSFFLSPKCKIHDFSLEGNSLDGAEFSPALGDALKNSSACPVRRICLRNNKLGFDGSEEASELESESRSGLPPSLIQGFTRNQSLESLDLSFNSFAENACRNIFTSLSSHPTLKSLNLEGNNIHDALSDLVEWLASADCKLEKLNLSSCVITPRKLRQLCQVLGENRTLKELILQANGFSGDLSDVFELAGKSETLVLMDLRDNSIIDNSQFRERLRDCCRWNLKVLV